MLKSGDIFPATREAAETRLEAFAPKAGVHYAQRRNFDFGPQEHHNVSALSPYVRLRLLDEVTLTRAVLAHHSQKEADKFLVEVFWRTYWKGWMELRPSVWKIYINDIKELKDELQTHPDLCQRWKTACLGQTGIAPFDAWAQELAQTGYLHNHARMWFASIWIFTLNLPWQLGADFFLRHLLDGDVAVNTLSWRWVAGIQTPGKTYLATTENIAKFTDGRFIDVPGSAQIAVPPEMPPPPPPGNIPPVKAAPRPERYGVLLHVDDIDLRFIREHAPDPVAFGYADATAAQSPWITSPNVTSFRTAAACSEIGNPKRALTDATQLKAWALKHRLEQVVTPYAPTGPMQDMLTRYQSIDGAPPLALVRRPLDSVAWPLATKGFFPFRNHIPGFIDRFALNL